jgi:hypothetical protein
MERQELIRKINQLPPDSVAKVEQLVSDLQAEPSDSERSARREAMAAFAAEYAGTEWDLDREPDSPEV